MFYKFEVYQNNIWQNDFYYECDEQDATELKKTILASVMEFKTACIVANKPFNTYHLVNWLRKYKHIEFVPAPMSRIVRVDM